MKTDQSVISEIMSAERSTWLQPVVGETTVPASNPFIPDQSSPPLFTPRTEQAEQSNHVNQAEAASPETAPVLDQVISKRRGSRKLAHAERSEINRQAALKRYAQARSIASATKPCVASSKSKSQSKYWDRMTPAQRSAEIKRRIAVARSKRGQAPAAPKCAPKRAPKPTPSVATSTASTAPVVVSIAPAPAPSLPSSSLRAQLLAIKERVLTFASALDDLLDITTK